MITFWAGASEPATTHEAIARDRLVPLLRQRFADRDGMVAAVFDVYCGGDLDLLILKESGIIVVELKECASPISASENGSWAIRDGSPGEVLRGGSHGNPYRQVRAYRFALMTWMDQHAPDFMSSQKAAHLSFAHIAGVVALSPYLHPDSELDIDFRGQPWFHLVGFDELAARIDGLRSPEISLTADEIERIVRHSLRCDQLMLASKDWEIHDPFVSLPATPPAAGASLVPDTEQDRAVEHRGTYLKIAAAVGTGKTTVLVRRAVQLAQQDGAGALLVITFSSQAAAKLYQQLRQLAPADLLGLWLGTFHSICRRMLVEHAEKMGYSQAFGVVDQADAMAVIERCVPEGSFADPGRLWALWSFAKNSLQPWQRIVTKPPFDAIKTPEPVLGCIHDGYTARLRHSDRMDFDDLLVNCLELLESHPTMKPLALIERAIANATQLGQLVLDPFLGSGTAIMAGERTGRTCYGFDLDPHYCAVILARWEEFTGEEARRADPPDGGRASA